jgi:hypothetical protein
MRIDESKIFDAYMKSLIVEKKKMPEGFKKFQKGKKKEDGDEDKKEKGKGKGKGKNLPPWLKKKGKKVVKEEFEMDGDDNGFAADMEAQEELGSDGGEISSLLQELETTDPELFQRLSEYLASREGADEGDDVYTGEEPQF